MGRRREGYHVPFLTGTLGGLSCLVIPCKNGVAEERAVVKVNRSHMPHGGHMEASAVVVDN